MTDEAPEYRRSTPEEEAEVDDALGLQLISIRLQKDLIRELKVIAHFRGTRYQPLIREFLREYARGSLLAIAEERMQDDEVARRLHFTTAGGRDG